MQSVDPGSPSRDEFNERIGREREETDEFADNYSTVNNGVQIVALATGIGAIFREGGKWAARKVILSRLAATGAGAAAGYGIGKGLEATCDYFDADEVTRGFVAAGLDLAAAIVLRRRSAAAPSAPAGTYRPLNPLPRGRNGEMVPSSQYPHTQLGTETGRKVGPYTAAREFGPDGQPLRDIHFTDHGRPNVPGHTNPHQHRHIPTPTGGTPEYGPAEPFIQ
jgi:hypothetical protein